FVSRTPDASIHITHDGNGIRVQSPSFNAHCDHVTLQDGQNRVLLEGNVRLSVHGENQPARIEAQRVLVNLRDGSFEVNPSAPLPMPTPVRAPVWTMPVSPAPMPSTCPFAVQVEERIQAPVQKEPLPCTLYGAPTPYDAATPYGPVTVPVP